ncbi:MAG: hypothetical protein NT173_09595 [Opitutales bacterium]|nr:hypothetical protein [Opitutales bacterium]
MMRSASSVILRSISRRQAAGGVDPRAQAEGDVDGMDAVGRLDAGDAHQRPQAGAAGLLQDAQAVAGEDAVLAEQRHEVGHRAQGHQVQVVAELERQRHRVLLGAELLDQAVGELEDEPDGAEVAPRRIGAGLVGLDVRVDQQALRRANWCRSPAR